MKRFPVTGLLVSFILFIFLVISSCKSDPASPEQDADVYPDSGLSYSKHIRPTLIQDCASSGSCHQSGVKAGGLDLETDPPDFLNSHNGPVVIAFSSNQSWLYLLLFQAYPGVSRVMPLNAARLSDAKIKAIGTWIDEGANTAN